MKKKKSRSGKVIFVGMGPSRLGWEKALFEAETRGEAIDICAKDALSGSLGEKLMEIGGFESFKGYDRANLNSRWNGKSGKGDIFDKIEGKRRAEKLLQGEHKYYVLLGAEVAKCFGYGGTPLEAKFDEVTEKEFLFLPHPSGVNSWWNLPFNQFRAKKRLREFLALAKA